MFNVKDTNIEALRAKKSAIMKGYMEDNFINFFVPEPVKKEILLNRGYWIRSHSFRVVTENFIEQYDDCQVISLGAGLDTLPFNLLSQYTNKNFVYFEIDLKSVVEQKINIIQKHGDFIGFMKKIEDFKISIHKDQIISKKYKLFKGDLNEPQEIMENLESHKVDFEKPTLIISECVLVYLNEGSVDDLYKRFSSKFEEIAWIDYEMFNQHDNFGKMMVKNFSERGIPLLSIHDFDDLSQIKNHFEKHFKECDIYTMKDLYYNKLNRGEVERINSLEWIDEYEEFNLICGHYFIAIARKYTKGESKIKNVSFEMLAQLNQIYYQNLNIMKIVFLLLHFTFLSYDLDEDFERKKQEILEKNEDMNTTQNRLENLTQNYLKVEELNQNEEHAQFSLNQFSTMTTNELSKLNGFYSSQENANFYQLAKKQIPIPKVLLDSIGLLPYFWNSILEDIEKIFTKWKALVLMNYLTFQSNKNKFWKSSDKGQNKWDQIKEDFLGIQDDYNEAFQILKMNIKNTIEPLQDNYKEYLNTQIYGDLYQKMQQIQKYIAIVQLINTSKNNFLSNIIKHFKKMLLSIENQFQYYIESIQDEILISDQEPVKLTKFTKCRGKNSLYCKVLKELQLPSKVNWVEQKKVTSVRDQGYCGSCWAFVVNSTVESLYLQKKNQLYDFSEQQLINCVDGNDCDGGYLYQTFQYVQKRGIVEESQNKYQYFSENGPFNTTCSNKDFDLFKIDGFITLNDNEFFKNIEDNFLRFLYLLSKGPVTVGIFIDNFLNYSSGILDESDPQICPNHRRINHAVVAVAYYIDEKNENNSYVLYKNSWGSNWGEKGYFRFKLKNRKSLKGHCNSLVSPVDIIKPYFKQ